MFAPTLKKNQTLKVCGSNQKLGDWEANKAIQMNYMGDSLWSITLDYNPDFFPAYIKFIVFNALDNNIYYWEYGENRLLEIVDFDNFSEIIFSGFLLKHSQNTRHESGVAMVLVM